MLVSCPVEVTVVADIDPILLLPVLESMQVRVVDVAGSPALHIPPLSMRRLPTFKAFSEGSPLSERLLMYKPVPVLGGVAVGLGMVSRWVVQLNTEALVMVNSADT